MKKSLKDQLLQIPSEKVIDLLFDLASDNEISHSKIERLVSKPQDNSSRFKKRLDQLKNRGGYIPWKYSSQFGDELSDLLADLENGVNYPEEGFELICDFYRADAEIFEQSDDSSGHIGDVFRNEAIDLFTKFAASHANRDYVIKTIIELVENDGYGVRDEIIAHADKFLSDDEVKKLYLLFEQGEKKKYSSWKLQSLAKQLKDAPLFEKLARQDTPDPNAMSPA